MKTCLNLPVVLLVFLATAAPVLAQSPTAITYQGQLLDGGQPANGYYDFRFSLHADAADGTPVANVIAKPPIAVTNGIFTTVLDFGAAGFSGGNRWLEIAIRPTGDRGNYLRLLPRQRITAAPYALQAMNVADGAVTAQKLSAIEGEDGQVLTLSNGQLAWGTSFPNSGVAVVNSGFGLLGGPITNTGTLAVDTNIIPRLNASNLFDTGPQTLASGGAASPALVVRGALGQSANLQEWQDGAGALTAAVRPDGGFAGNGAGLTNLQAAALSYWGTNPPAGRLLASTASNTPAWFTPAQLGLGGNAGSGIGVDGGTGNNNILTNLMVSSNAPFGRALIVNGGSIFNAPVWVNSLIKSGALLTEGDVRIGGNLAIAGIASGNGGNLVALNASNISTGTLNSARLPADVALRSTHQVFTASNVFTGVVTATNGANRFAGVFTGNGAGLTNLGLSFTNALGGDVTGSPTATTVARIRNVNVLATSPAANQHLRFNGSAWAPGAVVLGTDVSGTLAITNGGTGSTTAAGGRSNLGAAASGANTDITALSGLTTPLSAAQGGSGNASYAVGDLLYASAANILARRAIGAAGQVLASRNGVPVWTNANDHDHFGQLWSGTTGDGLFIENISPLEGASGVSGVARNTIMINYGLFGQSASVQGVGVQGLVTATNGATIGVGGESASPAGIGVYGLATATSGTNTGVFGDCIGPFGSGVYGQARATTGTPVGVFGFCAATNGYGLYTPNRLYVGNNAFVGGHLTLGTGSRIQAHIGSSNAPGITFFNNPTAGIFSPATNQLGLVTSGNQRLLIVPDGKVGIGRVPAANRLEVQGEASKLTAGSWLANSDAAIKTDVKTVTGALAKLERVRPVTFRYTEEYRRQHPEIEDKVYYNVIAQEFGEVFPEAVKSSGERIGDREILQVDTYPATITAMAAVRELHQLVEARERELAELRTQNEQLAARLTALENRLGNSSK